MHLILQGENAQSGLLEVPADLRFLLQQLLLLIGTQVVVGFQTFVFENETRAFCFDFVEFDGELLELFAVRGCFLKCKSRLIVFDGQPSNFIAKLADDDQMLVDLYFL